MAWAKTGNIKGPVGATGSTGAQGPQGSPGVGFTWRGTWSGSTAYAVNDCVQRTNQSYICTIANTGNDPASDVTHWNLMAAQGGTGATGPAGSTGAAGPAGENANTLTVANFTVPAVGSTVVVSVADTGWIVVGQMLYVDTAGGGTGIAGAFQVTAKTSTTVTLLNPAQMQQIPLAGTAQAGLMAQLTGRSSDYVGGDNACHPVPGAIPTGTVWDFAGSTLPAGWLWCDGSAQSRATQSALFAAIGTTYGAGDGSTTFNLPDLRGKVSVGVGQGSGLTNRVLAATGGEETHTQSIAELPAHSHPIDSYASSGYAAGGIAQGVFCYASGNYSHGSQNTGSGTPFNVVQPFLVLNKMIKT